MNTTTLKEDHRSRWANTFRQSLDHVKKGWKKSSIVDKGMGQR